MTDATANGNGAMSRGDTAIPRVRCGGDTGRSSIRDPGWARIPIKRDTMTLGKSRCTHPPRCTIISNKPKMEKTISARRIETGGNQCYIGKFQIRGLSIILGQRERAGLRLTKMRRRKRWQQSHGIQLKEQVQPGPQEKQMKKNFISGSLLDTITLIYGPQIKEVTRTIRNGRIFLLFNRS